MKTMFVYQDLTHFKQMQEQADGVETDERVESDPRTMFVDFKSADEVEFAVWNGIAHKLQEPCTGSPTSSPSKPSSGGEGLRGNLFREYRRSNNFDDGLELQKIERLSTFGSFVSSSSDSLDDNITEDYFSYPRE